MGNGLPVPKLGIERMYRWILVCRVRYWWIPSPRMSSSLVIGPTLSLLAIISSRPLVKLGLSSSSVLFKDIVLQALLNLMY